jgi:hypothetical protein
MLDWLTPREMCRAIRELRRVAETLIVTIRHGVEEWRVNQTHDLNKFYAVVNGLHIRARRETETTSDGIEEIMLLSPPTWDDVLEQFRYHGGPHPAFEAERCARAWFKDAGLYKDGDARPGHVRISAEYRRAANLARIIDKMGAEHDRDRPDELCYVTNAPPRFTEGPATILCKGGRTVVLDGRRRICQWRKANNRHPVLALYA